MRSVCFFALLLAFVVVSRSTEVQETEEQEDDVFEEQKVAKEKNDDDISIEGLNIDIAREADFTKPDSRVHLLTNQTLDDTLKNNQYVFLFIYASWDGNSKKVIGVMEELADMMKDEKVFIGKIDGDKYSELQERYSITYFPTILLFKNGQVVYSYNNRRKTATVFKHLIEKMWLPEVEVVKTIDDVKQLRQNWNLTLGILTTLEEVASFTVFAEATTYASIKKVLILVSSVDEAVNIAKELDVYVRKPELPMYLYLPVDDFGAQYIDGLTNFEKYEKFTETLAVPTFSMVDYYNFTEIRSTDLPFFWFHMNSKDPKHNEHFDMIRKEIAPFRGEAVGFFLDNETDYRTSKILSIDLQHLPGFTIFINDNWQRQYLFNSTYVEMTSETLREFLTEYRNGILPEFIVSEPDQNEYDKDENGNTKSMCNLYGTTIMKAINDNKLSHFIYYYAPECYSCKVFDKMFEDIAKQMKKEQPKLRLCKIDVTKNRFPRNLAITGFPALVLYRPGEEAIYYSGSRTKNNLINFLHDPSDENTIAGIGEDHQDVLEMEELERVKQEEDNKKKESDVKKEL